MNAFASKSEQPTPSPQMTVAMPVFNAGRYLRAAVLSIVHQTFTDWELLLIDDGSTDGSVDALGDLLKDSRIKVLRDGLNKGLAARLNEAIDAARGEFFARMDQDDISYPERFAQQLTSLQQNADLDLIACRCLRISQDDVPVGVIPFAASHAALCAMSWRGIHLAHPAWMGRTAWFREHRYAQPGPYFCEDQELLLRAADSSTYGAVDEVLFAYRVRDTLPWRKTLRTRRTLMAIQCSHFLRHGRLVSASLSFAVFCVNCLRDTANVVLRRAPHANGAGTEMADLARQFDQVRRSISA